MQEVALCDVADVLMGQSPPGGTYNEEGRGLPFFQGTRDFKERSPVPRVYCNDSRGRLADEGDILLSIRAPIGRVNVASEACMFGRGIASVRCLRPQDQRFLEFVLRNMQQTWGALESGGAVFGNARRSDLETLVVQWPEELVRSKVAAVLSAYDDLIENSLRRIEILEEMTRNLYREWFVEFRFPGHEEVHLVKSPLGPIPEGWRIARLGDLLELKYGKGLKLADRQPGDVPVYGSSGVIGWHDSALVAGPGVIVGRKGNVGSVFWSATDFFPIDTVYFVTSTALPLRFLYFDLQAKNFINSDAAVPGLSRKHALGVETLVPPDEVLSRFCPVVEELQREAALLVNRNATLRRTRDLLLPKLVSGEIDVSDLPVRMPPLHTGDPHRIAGYRFFGAITALPFVTKVVLFGSRARGDHEERSDIDLCVFCPEGATEEDWMQVLACLERDRVDTLLKVDCVRFETADAALQENVLAEGIVLYKRREGP